MFIAGNIRYLRKKAGYSQNDLAELFGYRTFTTIQKWESGDSTPPIDKCEKLSEIFGISIDDLVKKDLSHEDDEISRSGSFDYYTLTLGSDVIGQTSSERDILYLEKQVFTDRGDKVSAYMRLNVQKDCLRLDPVDGSFYAEPFAFETVSILRVLRRRK